MQKILIVVVAAALLYVLMQQGSSVDVQPAVQGNCVDALHAEYRAQWSEMNQVQRAMACAVLGIPKRLAVGIYLGLVFGGFIWGLAVQP